MPLKIKMEMPNLKHITPDKKNIRKAMKGVSKRYLRIQTEKINRGKDVHGRPFRPYSPEYKQLKSDAGMMGRNYWLRLSGHMLRSQQMTEKPKSKKGYETKISFVGSRSSYSISEGVTRSTGKEIQNSLLASVIDKTRKFIGIGKRDVKRLMALVQRYLK